MESLVETFDADSSSETPLEITTDFKIDDNSCKITTSKGSSLFADEGLTVGSEQKITHDELSAMVE